MNGGDVPPYKTEDSKGNPLPSDEAPGHFLGGNLQGITAKINEGYFKELGVDALWLSPVNQGAAYHGYHVTDFNKVDARFGGEAAFDAMIETAHAKGMKVIMDFVPNHVHETHPWFVDAKNNPDSPYRDWFYWETNKEGKQDYKKFLWFGELPKLNLDNPECREVMIGSMKHWMDKGVDGFRMDHAFGPSKDFWAECCKQLKAKNPECAMISEGWFHGISAGDLHTLNSLKWKRSYLRIQKAGEKIGKLGEKLGGCRLSNWAAKKAKRLSHKVEAWVLDSSARQYAPYFDGILSFGANHELQGLVKGTITEEEAKNRINAKQRKLPEGCRQVVFMDNHDMDSLLLMAGNDEVKVAKAIGVMFESTGIPVIYQGDEFGKDHAQITAMQSALVCENFQPEKPLQEKRGWFGDLVVRVPLKFNGKLTAALTSVFKICISARKRKLGLNLDLNSE